MVRDNPANTECQLKFKAQSHSGDRGAWKNEMDSDNMNLNNYGDNFNSHKGLGSEKYQAELYSTLGPALHWAQLLKNNGEFFFTLTLLLP